MGKRTTSFLIASLAMMGAFVVVFGCSSFEAGDPQLGAVGVDAADDGAKANVLDSGPMTDDTGSPTADAGDGGGGLVVLWESGFEGTGDCQLNTVAGGTAIVRLSGDMSAHSCQVCPAQGLLQRSISLTPNGSGVFKVDFTVREDVPDAGVRYDARVVLYVVDGGAPRTTTVGGLTSSAWTPGQVRTEFHDGLVYRAELEFRRGSAPGCFLIDNVRFTLDPD
jgi:hypothetical protein